MSWIIVPFSQGYDVSIGVGYCLLPLARSFHNLSSGNGNSPHAFPFFSINSLPWGLAGIKTIIV